MMASLGLSPTRVGRSGWAGPWRTSWLSFHLLLSKWNYGDAPDGYEFTAEFEVARDRDGLPLAGGRLFDFLTAEEREEHRKAQNLVIAKLPLDEEELEHLPPEWQADRLARVAPRLVPYPPSVRGLWFRYMDEQDVRTWMPFIGRVLPGVLDRLWSETVIDAVDGAAC